MGKAAIKPPILLFDLATSVMITITKAVITTLRRIYILDFNNHVKSLIILAFRIQIFQLFLNHKLNQMPIDYIHH